MLFAIVAGRRGRGREGKGREGRRSRRREEGRGGMYFRSGKCESQRIVGAGQERRE